MLGPDNQARNTTQNRPCVGNPMHVRPLTTNAVETEISPAPTSNIGTYSAPYQQQCISEGDTHDTAHQRTSKGGHANCSNSQGTSECACTFNPTVHTQQTTAIFLQHKSQHMGQRHCAHKQQTLHWANPTRELTSYPQRDCTANCTTFPTTIHKPRPLLTLQQN